MLRLVLAVILVLVVSIATALAVATSGRYNVAADVPHSDLVHGLLERARANSVRHHSRYIQTPTDLTDSERIRRGAGNYDAMCVDCHLAPGVASSEISQGLYPRPPRLSTGPAMPPAEAFWVIRHGIKASGMPGWGHSMEDGYIWDMVALLQVMPGLSGDDYRALVDASPGHSHGGGEGMEHDHHRHDAAPTDDHQHPDHAIPGADAPHQHDHQHDHEEDPAHEH